jgi:hypothetical protein
MVYLVSFQLTRPMDEYVALDDWLRLERAERISRTLWVVESRLSASMLRDRICADAEDNDMVFVAEITRAAAHEIPTSAASLIRKRGGTINVD